MFIFHLVLAFKNETQGHGQGEVNTHQNTSSHQKEEIENLGSKNLFMAKHGYHISYLGSLQVFKCYIFFADEYFQKTRPNARDMDADYRDLVIIHEIS